MLQPPPYSDSPEQDGGDDLRILSEKASENAKLAVEADKNGEIDFAFYRYIDAIEALQLMILHINNSGGRSSSQNVQVVDNLMKQIDQYLSRAEQLKATMLQPAVIKTEDGTLLFFFIQDSRAFNQSHAVEYIQLNATIKLTPDWLICLLLLLRHMQQ